MNFEREEEGSKESDNIDEIMGKAMDMARAVQEASHKMKGVEDMEGQEVFNATRKEAAEVLRKAAQALDPERHKAKNKEKKKGQKKRQRTGVDSGRQEKAMQKHRATASRRRSSSTCQKRHQKP